MSRLLKIYEDTMKRLDIRRLMAASPIVATKIVQHQVTPIPFKPNVFIMGIKSPYYESVSAAGRLEHRTLIAHIFEGIKEMIPPGGWDKFSTGLGTPDGFSDVDYLDLQPYLEEPASFRFLFRYANKFGELEFTLEETRRSGSFNHSIAFYNVSNGERLSKPRYVSAGWETGYTITTQGSLHLTTSGTKMDDPQGIFSHYDISPDRLLWIPKNGPSYMAPLIKRMDTFIFNRLRPNSVSILESLALESS